MATVFGTGGDDTLDGTDENDTIYGEAGADSITAGAGDDFIFGNGPSGAPDGADTIDAGDGNDTVQASDGDDVVRGGAGSDSLLGEAGNDSIEGGSGNDTINGNAGQDTLLGGDGDDLIYGAEGDDELSGGGGSDTLYGGTGSDVFVVTAESGFTSIEDYSAGDGDLIAIDYPGIESYEDLAPYLSDDGNFGTFITLPDGSQTQIKFLSLNSQDESNFTFRSGPVCFLKGTLIDTARGPRPVETLAAGDLVETLDSGARPILSVTRRSYRFGDGAHKMKPIRIRAGALGEGSPRRELLISPQHRLGVPAARPDHIVAARHFLGYPGVAERPGCRITHYYHVLLETHELIRANGAWAETLLVTERTAGVTGTSLYARLVGMTPVRPIAKRPLIDAAAAH